MLSECSWFRTTAGQKDYAGRMKLMEQSRNEHYAALGVPPGPPTAKGIWGEPETTGQALTSTTLGNYDIPDNWPQPPVKNEPGDVPGPPVQYGPAVNPDDVAPGYGFSQSLPQRENDIYFYHSDHLGSTSYITDSEGAPTQFVCYMPFGEAFVDEHSTRPEMPYKFNGKEQDQETGLYYYGARYYEPGECRFYGVDPLAEQHPNYNPVAYCYNNPVKFIDPLGLDTLSHGATGVKAGDVYNNGDGTYTPAQSTQLNEVTVTADKKTDNTNGNVDSRNGMDVATNSGGSKNDDLGLITEFVGLGFSKVDNAGLSLHYLNKSGKLRVYSNWKYGNQHTTNTKLATRGTALLFGINQYSISRSYLTGETNFSQFKTGTETNILGSLSPQFGLMFMTNSAINITENAWNQYNSQPNTLRQFYNNMMSSFEGWKRCINRGF